MLVRAGRLAHGACTVGPTTSGSAWPGSQSSAPATARHPWSRSRTAAGVARGVGAALVVVGGAVVVVAAVVVGAVVTATVVVGAVGGAPVVVVVVSPPLEAAADAYARASPTAASSATPAYR